MPLPVRPPAPPFARPRACLPDRSSTTTSWWPIRLRRALAKTLIPAALVWCGLAGAGGDCAQAFTHIVQPGDTLASLSERFYGRVQNERIVVAANGLDAEGGIRIVPGMRLEIPSLMTVRVGQGETWKDLARQFLGSEYRAFSIAQANDSQPWLLPENGAEVIVPYNLRVVARGDETIVGLAYRYLGDRKAAWALDQYNERKGRRLMRGEVVLVPLVDLELTELGKRAAALSVSLTEMEARGSAREEQLYVQRELPQLSLLVQRGQYVEAVRLGVALSNTEALTQRQLAAVHRQLLEAYVALDARGRATESCRHWLDNDEQARLDPVEHSPKMITACRSGGDAKPSAPKNRSAPRAPSGGNPGTSP